MDILKQIKNKAKDIKGTIVLPEGWDERILKASEIINREKLVDEIIIPNPLNSLNDTLDKLKIDIESIATVYGPQEHPEFNTFVDEYYQLRKHKKITKDDAVKTMSNPIYFASMLLRKGEADGAVMGADTATAETIRSALHSVGLREDTRTLSSFFIMITPRTEFGTDGILLYADCAVLPYPNEKQLADIAIQTAKNARTLLNMEPKIAMLSFSTKGSACHPSVDKVIKATEIVKSREPDLLIDGEFQVDTAIVPEVAERKAPDSVLHGDANCLIFPDLNSGNIAYKLTQRLGGASAIGPIFQGLKKPVNDLSRGCSVEDIVNVVAFTIVQTSV